MKQAVQGSGHEPKLLEFKKRLDNTLRHRVWFLVVQFGARVWTQWLLWVLSNFYDSMSSIKKYHFLHFIKKYWISHVNLRKISVFIFRQLHSSCFYTLMPSAFVLFLFFFFQTTAYTGHTLQNFYECITYFAFSLNMLFIRNNNNNKLIVICNPHRP